MADVEFNKSQEEKFSQKSTMADVEFNKSQEEKFSQVEKLSQEDKLTQETEALVLEQEEAEKEEEKSTDDKEVESVESEAENKENLSQQLSQTPDALLTVSKRALQDEAQTDDMSAKKVKVLEQAASQETAEC